MNVAKLYRLLIDPRARRTASTAIQHTGASRTIYDCVCGASERLSAGKEDIMSATETDWGEMLEACETVEQLRAYAEQMPAAPWEFPATAEELWRNGGDLLVRLRSGEVAYWSDTDREWSVASIDRIAPLRALDLVVVEQMPEWLCGCHEAAHNYGCYPANGAERSIMPRRDAEALCDDDSYDHIVRDARDSDLGRYGRIVV